MRRTIIWVDTADSDAHHTRQLIKEYLTKAGIKHSIFEASEIMESEN